MSNAGPYPTLAHEIEAIPNSGGGITHYCHVCGRMGVSLAPELPCAGFVDLDDLSTRLCPLCHFWCDEHRAGCPATKGSQHG